MANDQKISQLASYSTPTYADVLPIVDTANSETKEITVPSLFLLPAQTYAPTAAGTATLDLTKGNEHRITLPAGNITIAKSGDSVAQKFIVSITQDSVGSRTVTWFSAIRWVGGTVPTLTTTANKRDTFGFIRTGTNTYDGFVVGQNI